MKIVLDKIQADLNHHFSCHAQSISDSNDLLVAGKLVRVVGLTLEAIGCNAALGERCLIKTQTGELLEAEVIGFGEDKTYLMPVVQMKGLKPGALIIPANRMASVAVGEHLLGRVLDGLGEPLDKGAPITSDLHYPLYSQPLNPLLRNPICDPLDVGVQSINAMLTVGCGQRIGLFAGSGVGKSVLLGMMTRYTQAEVVVVGLVGERGREVKEFIENSLGKEGLARSVVVATPADNSPLMRLHGALIATSIAEYFRDQGKKVLLLMDSLTRFAQAQREISLAAGEPPTSKGYTPSVFTKLSELVERAGSATHGNGSITAFYTVLAEGDDQQDPIVDAARAILDGHIVLSRNLAAAGHFPAIDIEASLSRVMVQVVSQEHQQAALRFRQLYSKYQQNKDLITIGAYVRGSDAGIDQAIQQIGKLNRFLCQGTGDKVLLRDSVKELVDLSQQFAVITNESTKTPTTYSAPGSPTRTN